MLWLLQRIVKPKFTWEIKRKYRGNTKEIQGHYMGNTRENKGGKKGGILKPFDNLFLKKTFKKYI